MVALWYFEDSKRTIFDATHVWIITTLELLLRFLQK